MTSNGINGVHTEHLNGTNGIAATRSLKPGIFAPIPAFFLEGSEDLDLESFATHVVRVAKAGVGPLISGSMGEAHHLTHSERKVLIQTARRALDDAGLHEIPLIAGTGAGSTRETIHLCKEAAADGADFVIVIASGYYAGALANDRKALKAFFVEVAEKSPLPVIIYNFPGASGGIDLDSDLIVELAEECPNMAGVKLTCGNVGKLTRICATVSDPAFTSRFPRKNPKAPFLVLGGFIDFLVPSTYANGHGAITGLANVAPHTITKLFQLSESSLQPGSATLLAKAQRIQGVVARADFTIAKASIAGTKALLEKLFGYGGKPRRPLPPTAPEAIELLWNHPHTQELVKLERLLSSGADTSD